ncbi:MAG: hypothetical protein OHK0012_06540 [Synechococcales cyanobacterium]
MDDWVMGFPVVVIEPLHLARLERRGQQGGDLVAPGSGSRIGIHLVPKNFGPMLEKVLPQKGCRGYSQDEAGQRIRGPAESTRIHNPCWTRDPLEHGCDKLLVFYIHSQKTATPMHMDFSMDASRNLS